jgi:radical SAM superfamily enzyme YgiQ (UPF0313 family)
MKQTLFISFDLIREGELSKPLAIASILAYLKSDEQLTEKMSFEHLSINSLKYTSAVTVEVFNKYISNLNIARFDFIAISAYIWNEYLINNFINQIRLYGFTGNIILGGYQISYSNNNELRSQYPDAQIFISGYAEQSLKELFHLTNLPSLPLFLNTPVDFSEIPSVYTTNEIIVPENTKMLRLETKRGCPYRCSFCAHRDLTQNKVYKHSLDKIFQEISFIKDRNISKVNILDPIFNAGKDYLAVMKEINNVNISTKFTLQSRFENLISTPGIEFLNFCEADNYHLEFGVQTVVGKESENINRKNNIVKIDEALKELKDRNISYEVSIIYGLPEQTLDSFKYSIDYLLDRGCTNIKAYPLMLLRGTELFNEKEKWDLKEGNTTEYAIPIVTSSKSFTYHDWQQMNYIAENLQPSDRI